MPAIISHWLFGKKMLPELRKLPELESMDENSFIWGCQGPDILFYSSLMPWMFRPSYSKYGTLLHEEHSIELLDVLAGMLTSYAGADRDRMLGYCMGMCCHYSLDRITHPLIYWLEYEMRAMDKRGPDYHYHGEIESMLDLILLRRESGDLTCDLRLTDCLPGDQAVSDLAAHIYSNVLQSVFSVKGDARTMRSLLSDTIAAFRLLDDRYYIKRRPVAAAEKLFGIAGAATAFMRPVVEDLDYDYANFCRREWYSPHQPDIRGTEDFIELYDRAADDACNIAACFIRAADGDGTLENYTGRITFSGYVLPSKKTLTGGMLTNVKKRIKREQNIYGTALI